ncbi:hypothetical protein C8J57DRAFT_1564357, partial [Mycena rebaudengoi]
RPPGDIENPVGSWRLYSYQDGETTTTERRNTDKKQKPPSKGTKCDHIVELNILKKVMEDGGICDRLAEQYGSGSVDEANRAVDSISGTINNFNNLVFADLLLEDEKTAVVKFNFDQSDLNVLKVQGADDAATANRLKAVNDYLIRTQDKSSGSAAALDAAIKAAFPKFTSTVKVVDLWDQVLETGKNLADNYLQLVSPDTPPPPPSSLSPSFSPSSPSGHASSSPSGHASTPPSSLSPSSPSPSSSSSTAASAASTASASTAASASVSAASGTTASASTSASSKPSTSWAWTTTNRTSGTMNRMSSN